MKTANSEIIVFDSKLIEEKEYWIKKLSGDVEVSDLLADFDRPAEFVIGRDLVEVIAPAGLYQKLVKLTGGSPFLIYVVLLASLKICLWKYTGNRIITVGSPSLRESGSQSGNGNILAIRNEIHGGNSFRELLLQVQETLLAAYERQRYPFNRLIKDLGLNNIENRCPLFDLLVGFREIHSHFPNLHHDLTLIFTGGSNELIGEIEFNPALFNRETIERFGANFLNLLTDALNDTGKTLNEIAILTERERHQLLVEWNNPREEFLPEECVHRIFEKQVEETPATTALVYGENHLTYSELNKRANQLAHYLQTRGVGPEVLVGIYIERSLEMLIGILGALKAGGAYLPLDPSYPRDLLGFMLANSQASVALTQGALKAGLGDYQGHVIDLNADWEVIAQESTANCAANVSIDNLAYMIYTSGSTGKPKGVMASHRGIGNLAAAQIHTFGVHRDSRVLQLASFSFDASVSEICMALLAGATLWLETREALLPEPDFIDLLRKTGITTVTFPPSMLSALPIEEIAALETIIVAGEPCSADLVAQWSRNRRFFNAYGPTEATVCATIAECSDGNRKPPIGRPIANTQVYLLDSDMRPAPIGAAGELHIGGIGLTRAYWNHPEQTAEKYAPNPFSNEEGGRLYKSGDIARYLPDGNIEFLNRLDHQVKVRGYRIELGEIESVLELHPGIHSVVVMAQQALSGENSLVAYLVAKSNVAPSVVELRRYLKDKLPDFMIPSAFMILANFPLTSNGKVDRRALPSLTQARPNLGGPLTLPRTPIEEKLAAIWAEVLKLEQVGIHDNFFDLGGHSLLATQIISRARKFFQISLPFRSLFEAPTIAGLAAIIVQRQIEQADIADTEMVLRELEALSDEEVKALLNSEGGAEPAKEAQRERDTRPSSAPPQ